MGTAARNTAILINGYDWSGYFDTFDANDEVDLQESTTFGPSVVGRSRTPTVQDCQISLVGFWATLIATYIYARIVAAITDGSEAVCFLWPVGDTVGNVGFAWKGYISSRKVNGKIDGLLGVSVDFKSNVGDEDVVSLHSMSTSELADFTGATVDNGAATTAGGSAYLQIGDISFLATVTIRHSSDNFAADDTLLCSFTAGQADRWSERVEISGTIKRYTRVVVDYSSGGGYIAAALHRN